MPLVSIITPVLPCADDHLAAAYQSIRDQVLPGTWEWEWLVHIDGGPIPAWVAGLDDQRVRVSAEARHHGAAVARNLLLSRSTGSHLKVLDADDQLVPGVLDRDLRAVAEHPQVAWKADEFRSPIHPTTLFADRRAVLALGGWMAVPTSEDTGLLLALNCQEDGFFSDEVGLTYRKWSKQVTSQDHHGSAELTRLRHAFIEQRCEALLAVAPPDVGRPTGVRRGAWPSGRRTPPR